MATKVYWPQFRSTMRFSKLTCFASKLELLCKYTNEKFGPNDVYSTGKFNYSVWILNTAHNKQTTYLAHINDIFML